MLRILKSINVLLIAVLNIAPSWPDSSPIKERSSYVKIKTLKPKISDRLASRIGLAIDKNCPRIQRDLVISIIFVESSFRPESVSETGDRGLTQISPGYAAARGLELSKLLDPNISVSTLCRFLAIPNQRWTIWHSKTPSKARAYKAKVKKAYLKIQERKI